MSAEDPIRAGEPGSRGETRTYERDGLGVEWDPTLCIHTARCIAAQPAVFDPTRRPWVDLSAASVEDVAAAVRRCPTGALRLRDETEPSPEPAVEVRPDGPLYVRGDVTVAGRTGQRFALCRCGATGNAPFCDNSHKAVGFRARENARDELTGAPVEGPVEVRVRPGPYRIRGARVVTPSGDVLADAAECVLCRCGRSARKPFCDGSHRDDPQP